MAEGGFDITTVPDVADNKPEVVAYATTNLIEMMENSAEDNTAQSEEGIDVNEPVHFRLKVPGRATLIETNDFPEEIDSQEGLEMLNLIDAGSETETNPQSDIDVYGTAEGESTDTTYDDQRIPPLPGRRMTWFSHIQSNVPLLMKITKMDNVFAIYSTFTIISAIGALATALFGICHLIYITSTNQLDNVGYGHIFLDLSMVGGSVLLLYIIYAYLTEKWTFGVCGLLAGLFFSLPTVACPSIMLFLKYDPVVITAIVSSCLVLLIWPLMGIFHYKAYYCRVRPTKL